MNTTKYKREEEVERKKRQQTQAAYKAELFMPAQADRCYDI